MKIKKILKEYAPLWVAIIFTVIACGLLLFRAGAMGEGFAWEDLVILILIFFNALAAARDFMVSKVYGCAVEEDFLAYFYSALSTLVLGISTIFLVEIPYMLFLFIFCSMCAVVAYIICTTKGAHVKKGGLVHTIPLHFFRIERPSRMEYRRHGRFGSFCVRHERK